MQILFQMHIAWFETEMALESIRSVQAAIQHTSYPVKVKLCFNAQTYFDTPIEGSSEEMFKILLEDDFVKQAEIVWNKDTDEFYNVGDWRRECYDLENITIWGEADCLVPETYFAYIESIFKPILHTTTIHGLQYPFIVSTRQKEMWDDSWKPTEHEAFQIFTLDQVRAINNKFVTGEGLLTLEELNKFNQSFVNQQQIVASNYYKGDGALVCLSPNMPIPFIAPDLHMCGEDTYFYNYCRLMKVPLYNISHYLKGHNTGHPLKRMNHKKTDQQKAAFQDLDNRMRVVASESLTTLRNR